MGFKGGKANAYHVLKAERDRLQSELNAERFKPALERFAREFGDDLLTVLAQTSYEYWPKVAKMAFEHAARRTPTVAHFYKLRLPK